MRMISRIAVVSVVLVSVRSVTGQEKTPGVVVTQETSCRAETDRTFNNTRKLAGGVNRFFHFRDVTPLDGPLPSFFDKTWVLPDVELVK